MDKILNFNSSSLNAEKNVVQETRKQVIDNANESLGTNKQDKGFMQRVASALDEVADAQNQSAAITKAYELGKEQDITKVMMKQQISSLGFQVTLNVRNKVLSAYKDIMNMPV